jgi:hypothetical protein
MTTQKSKTTPSAEAATNSLWSVELGEIPNNRIVDHVDLYPNRSLALHGPPDLSFQLAWVGALAPAHRLADAPSGLADGD